MAPFVTIEDLKARLAPLFDSYEDAAVVFDADGTLWSHDVGCMVFDEAVNEGLFREQALAPLLQEAHAHGIKVEGTSANDAARALQRAWYTRSYDERSTAEMQVWAYVGFTEQEFRALVNHALEKGKHKETLHGAVVQLADWVQAQGRRACIVSASPLWVVEEATTDLGIAPAEITA
jgi:phosphoserine phosphatase